MGFETGESIKDYLLDALEGGAFGGIGLVGYNKIGTTLSKYLGALGQYANLGASFIWAFALDYVSKYVGDFGGGRITEGVKVAGYTPLAFEIYNLVGTLMSGGTMTTSTPAKPQSEEAI